MCLLARTELEIILKQASKQHVPKFSVFVSSCAHVRVSFYLLL